RSANRAIAAATRDPRSATPTTTPAPSPPQPSRDRQHREQADPQHHRTPDQADGAAQRAGIGLGAGPLEALIAFGPAGLEHGLGDAQPERAAAGGEQQR